MFFLFVRNPVVSIQSRLDTSRFDTSQSRFVTPIKSIRYKLTLLVSIQNTITILYINDLNEPSKTYSLEGTQTSFVNEIEHLAVQVKNGSFRSHRALLSSLDVFRSLKTTLLGATTSAKKLKKLKHLY